MLGMNRKKIPLKETTKVCLFAFFRVIPSHSLPGEPASKRQPSKGRASVGSEAGSPQPRAPGLNSRDKFLPPPLPPLREGSTKKNSREPKGWELIRQRARPASLTTLVKL